MYAEARTQTTTTTTGRIQNYRQTDRHFLELSETCLYMVYLGLGPFQEIAKNCLHSFTIEVNQNRYKSIIAKYIN